MEKKVLREKLELLHYDFNKHHSIKDAFLELLSDRYSDILSGNLVDEDNLKQVSGLIDIYNEIKDCDLSILEEDEINNTDTMLSEIFVVDNKVLKKNNSTSEREVLFSDTNNVSYRVFNNTIVVGHDKKNTMATIYALNGSRIIDIPDVYFINDIHVSDVTDRLIFVKNYSSSNKSKVFLVDKVTKRGIESDNCQAFDRLVSLIFSINVDDFKKYNLFLAMYENQDPEYVRKLLSGKYVGFSFGQYIGIVPYYSEIKKDDQFSYYSFDGEKIIHTECDGYVSIEFKNGFYKSDDENHILRVSQYDSNFKLRYGYYDLDKREEIVAPCHRFVRSWKNGIGLILDDTLKVVNKNGDIIECGFPYYTLDNKDSDIFSYIEINENAKITNDKLFEYQKKLFDSLCLQSSFNLSSDIDTLKIFIADSVKLVNDDVYLVKYNAYFSKEPKEHYSLIKNLFSNPIVLEEKCDSILIYNLSGEYYCEKNGQSKKGFIKTNGNSCSKERLIDSSSQKDIMKGYLKSVLLSDYVVSSTYLSCNDGDNDEILNEYLKNGLIDSSKVFNDGNDEGFVNDLLSRENENFSCEKADCFKNRIIQFKMPFDREKENKMTKKILISSLGEVLIPYSNEIILANSNLGLYKAVTSNGVILYDYLGKKLTHEHGNIDFVKKYFVDSNGVIKKTSTRLLLTDGDYKRIADDDGEVCVYKSKEVDQALDKLKFLRKEIKKV